MLFLTDIKFLADACDKDDSGDVLYPDVVVIRSAFH
jgi:hypothetical protein